MSATRRIALGVEYNGAAFHGWQRQSDARTVQGELERALGAIATSAVGIVAAGRTDAGVHASGQVIHVDVPSSRPLSAWVRGVNSHLPADVAVRWAQPVADDFHARFCARGRAYRYLLLNRPVRTALQADRLGWHHRPLALEPMQDGAALLLGRHDFSSFRAAECQAATPVRELRRLDLRREGDLFIFDLEADAFLHHMVRNIVGALVALGQGNKPTAWIAELLAARDRKLAAPTFSPTGLYLTRVDYDAPWGIPLTPSEPVVL